MIFLREKTQKGKIFFFLFSSRLFIFWGLDCGNVVRILMKKKKSARIRTTVCIGCADLVLWAVVVFGALLCGRAQIGWIGRVWLWMVYFYVLWQGCCLSKQSFQTGSVAFRTGRLRRFTSETSVLSATRRGNPSEARKFVRVGMAFIRLTNSPSTASGSSPAPSCSSAMRCPVRSGGFRSTRLRKLICRGSVS